MTTPQKIIVWMQNVDFPCIDGLVSVTLFFSDSIAQKAYYFKLIL